MFYPWLSFGWLEGWQKEKGNIMLSFAVKKEGEDFYFCFIYYYFLCFPMLSIVYAFHVNLVGTFMYQKRRKVFKVVDLENCWIIIDCVNTFAHSISRAPKCWEWGLVYAFLLYPIVASCSWLLRELLVLLKVNLFKYYSSFLSLCCCFSYLWVFGILLFKYSRKYCPLIFSCLWLCYVKIASNLFFIYLERMHYILYLVFTFQKLK